MSDAPRARPFGYQGADQLPGWWTGLRGLPLAFLALPFVPALLFALIEGEARPIIGCLLALGGIGLAMSRLKRARRGDARRAAVLLGLGTGFATAMAGGTAPLAGVVLGLGAWAGARMLYDGVREMAPPQAPAAPPPPRPADGLDPFRSRLAWLRDRDARLSPAVAAMEELLAELAARPGEGGDARRVLAMGVDGLERIALRLGSGAQAPESLPVLVEDLSRAARDAAQELRSAETEALEIQVKVLGDRLRKEGLA